MPLTNLAIKSSVTRNATYTANAYDDLALVDATSASFTVNLPTAVGMNGNTLRFKRTDSTSANTVTLDANGAETINGSSTFVLIAQDQEIEIMSDGSNWNIVGQIKINASAYVAAPTAFTTTSASYTNVTGAQFSSKTLGGGAQAPATANDLALKIAFLPKGTYQVMCYIAYANAGSGSSVNIRMFDGTTQIGQSGTGNAQNGATYASGGLITYASDQSNITFTAQGKAQGGVTFQTSAFNGSSASDASIVITRLN